MLLFSCHCCKKPDSGAAPVQWLPVRTRGLWRLRGERPLLLRWGSHRTEDPSHSPDHRPIVPFLSPQTAGSSAWWTGAVPAPGEWRSLTRAPGAPSVMRAGTWTMPAWCAGSWAVEKPSMPRGLLTLGQDQDPSGWTTWTVQEMSLTCGGALPRAGGGMTADTSRTRGSSAQVCAAHCPQARGGVIALEKGRSEPWGKGAETLEKEASSHEACLSSRCEDEVLSLPPAAAEILVLSSQ